MQSRWVVPPAREEGARARGRVRGEIDQLKDGEKKAKTAREWDPRTQQENSQGSGRQITVKEKSIAKSRRTRETKSLNQVTRESDAKLDKSHEHLP